MSIIREEYDKIKRAEERLAKRLKKLRASCDHSNHTSIAESSTGNYDPSCDFYRYALSCNDCGEWSCVDQWKYIQGGKKWQDLEEYKRRSE